MRDFGKAFLLGGKNAGLQASLDKKIALACKRLVDVASLNEKIALACKRLVDVVIVFSLS